MFSQVVIDYLERFSNLVSQSVYASKGIQDYNKMRQFCDYLDYDRQTLFRAKHAPAGLRNIGNTCYLNVILQLLFHVNYLRQKVCASQHPNSKQHQNQSDCCKFCAVCRLLFADPSQLFQHLKEHSSLFVAGVQNDFHQIFTLLIDRISQGFKEVSPQEARFISKLLFGKMVTKYQHSEGTLSKPSVFNIINLEVGHGSFQKAFQSWRRFTLDFVTPKGSMVKAQAQNIFLETPALMIFFINRVIYKQGKLQKDSRQFSFKESILINKSQPSQKTQALKTQNIQKQQELNQQKKLLQQWLVKVQTNRANLNATLAYLRAKEAPLLSEPQVKVEKDEQAWTQAMAYLEAELKALASKQEQVRTQIISIDKKLTTLQSQGNYQKYILWAVMIHQGNSAVSGHYKVCINTGGQEWAQYNDRNVTPIPKSDIDQYRKKGQICCLFYRRPVLVCDTRRSPVPLSLKNLISQEETQVKQEMDKARLLQALYQQTQSANILLELQLREESSLSQFFFKPVRYAIQQKMQYSTCKGIIINDMINSQFFRMSLASKMVSDEPMHLPKIRFGIPQEYFTASNSFKMFLDSQSNIADVPLAYEQLAGRKIKFMHKNIMSRYTEMMKVIALKGIYYLEVFSKRRVLNKENYQRLYRAIDRILQNIGLSSEFALICIAIKSSLKYSESNPVISKTNWKAKAIDSYGDYFQANFNFWTKQLNKLSELDQSNFTKGAPLLPSLAQ